MNLVKNGTVLLAALSVFIMTSCGNAGGGGDDPKEKEWYEDTTYINSLTDADVTKEGGEIQTLKVNGLDHKVRLIGVEEDYEDEAKTKPIHTTWEFVNLISDENGHSLATQWNDTEEKSSSDHNYFDSSLRMALVGEHEQYGHGHILWAQKGATSWSDEEDSPYKNKTVLDMIDDGNSGFVDVLKTPSKYINIWNDTLSTPSFEEQVINDKLFLLSPREMRENASQQETKTSTYTYYKNMELFTDRSKKQVKENETYGDISYIPNSDVQTYKEYDVTNFAGYNFNGNGWYWLRSPQVLGIYYSSGEIWHVRNDGGTSNLSACSNALPIAPAFCI